MPSYSYKASTFEGKIVEGTMEALDDGTVSMKLQEMGLLPVQIGAPARQTLFRREIDWPWRRRKIRRKDLLVFTQELQTLVHAGFPLDRSLAVLSQLAESPAMAEVIQDVLKEVKGGKSFSEALAKYPAITLDGCKLACATKMVQECGGNVVKDFAVLDIYRRFHEFKPQGIAELNEGGQKLAEVLALEVDGIVDEMIGNRGQNA